MSEVFQEVRRPAVDAAVLLVSLDAHISPPVEAYREYCESKYLADYDAFVDAFVNLGVGRLTVTGLESEKSSPRRDRHMAKVAEFASDDLNGGDGALRLRSMDADGIAAEFVFHGGYNFQPIPFFSPHLGLSFSQDIPEGARAKELRAAGIRMYNRWLADWASIDRERILGLAHIPVWDIEATLVEVKAAYDSGLRGINLPAPRHEIPAYNHPAWDPLWDLCSEYNLALHTHSGGGEIFEADGPAHYALRMLEVPFAARRGLAQLILGQVFERFPDLRFVLTEQMGTWIFDALETLDSTYHCELLERDAEYIQDVLPREPSEYFRDNVLVGASFMSRKEAERAIEHGYWENMNWGRDFPHLEGTWPYTAESIRKTFAGLPEVTTRGMLGENAVRMMGLDRAKLSAVADRIGPSLADVNVPLEARPPESLGSLGFREYGMWG